MTVSQFLNQEDRQERPQILDNKSIDPGSIIPSSIRIIDEEVNRSFPKSSAIVRTEVHNWIKNIGCSNMENKELGI
jgi:hypothetical protein